MNLVSFLALWLNCWFIRSHWFRRTFPDPVSSNNYKQPDSRKLSKDGERKRNRSMGGGRISWDAGGGYTHLLPLAAIHLLTGAYNTVCKENGNCKEDKHVELEAWSSIEGSVAVVPEADLQWCNHLFQESPILLCWVLVNELFCSCMGTVFVCARLHSRVLTN